jgi:hypothetical protein
MYSSLPGSKPLLAQFKEAADVRALLRCCLSAVYSQPRAVFCY